MLKDFKNFIMKGNVLDLAVAFVIGAAFASVAKGFVDFIVMPIIGIIGGEPSFNSYLITINGSQILWGSFVTVCVSFLVIASAMFVVVKSFEAMQARRASEEEAADDLSTEDLLAEIRDLLKAQQG